MSFRLEEARPRAAFPLALAALLTASAAMAVPAPVSPLVPAARNAGQQFCVIGDSIAANGGTMATANGAGNARPGYGFTTWLTALLGERVNLDPAYNFAAGGTYTSQIAATAAAAAAANCQWVIAQGATNNIQFETSLTQTESDLTGEFNAILAAGKKLVIVTPFPRNAAAISALGVNVSFAQGFYDSVARFERRYAQQNPGTIVFDPRTSGIANLSTGDYLPNMSPDGTHPGALAAELVGAALANVLAPQLSTDPGPLPTDPLDLYNSANNITGNQLPNPLFAASTGGTWSSTTSAVTGAAPASWGLSFVGKAGAAYSGSATVAVTSRTDGNIGNWLTMAAVNLAGGSNYDYFYYIYALQFAYLGTPNGNLNAGDTVEGVCEFQVNNTRGLRSIGLTTWAVDGSIAQNGVGQSVMGATDTNGVEASGGGNYFWPTGSYNIVLRLPAFKIQPAQGTGTRWINFQPRIELDTTVSGGATVTVSMGRCSLRKVIY